MRSHVISLRRIDALYSSRRIYVVDDVDYVDASPQPYQPHSPHSPISSPHPAQEMLSEEEESTGQSVTKQGDIVISSPRKQSVSSDQDDDNYNDEYEDTHKLEHSQDQEEEAGTGAEPTAEAGAERQREERMEQGGGSEEGGAQPSGAEDETLTADPALELPTPWEEEEEAGGVECPPQTNKSPPKPPRSSFTP